MQERFDRLIKQIEEALSATTNEYELNNVRSRFLGKKSDVTAFMKQLGSISPEERPEFGKRINELKRQMEKLIELRAKKIARLVYEKTLSKEQLDLTMPGLSPDIGALHPLTQMQRRLEDIFISLGFDVVEGNDIEDEYHNFDALNTPESHPARNEMDTFYIKDLTTNFSRREKGNRKANRLLLRSQTSTVQVRIMETIPPPIKIISIGRCYRNDKPDRSHSPFFHQIEGLCVDKGINFADLREILSRFAVIMFGDDIKWRFRPHFFPFTEPSAEFDILCFNCYGKGCPICKHSGWIEIGGAGMVDPNVFDIIGIDSELYTGYAFGLGIDRITLLKYRLPDIRLLFENDLRFLKQF